MSAREAAALAIRGKSWKVQRVCKNGGEAVSITIVGGIKLARDRIEAKCKNET